MSKHPRPTWAPIHILFYIKTRNNINKIVSSGNDHTVARNATGMLKNEIPGDGIHKKCIWGDRGGGGRERELEVCGYLVCNPTTITPLLQRTRGSSSVCQQYYRFSLQMSSTVSIHKNTSPLWSRAVFLNVGPRAQCRLSVGCMSPAGRSNKNISPRTFETDLQGRVPTCWTGPGKAWLDFVVYVKFNMYLCLYWP